LYAVKSRALFERDRIMVSFYKAHKGDYYCRELPYRIYKSDYWIVKRITDKPTNRNIELYADSLKEAKNYVKEQAK